MEQLVSLLIISLAVSTISLTISKSKIFASTREFISDRFEWLGEMISCFYCLSHWVAVIVVTTTHFETKFGWVVTVLAVICLASIFSSIIIGLTGGAGHNTSEE